jgi:hypothetical protein
MPVNIQFDVPVDIPREEATQKAKELFLCNLYDEEKMTEKQVCELLGITRWQFQALLTRYHIPQLRTLEDANDEILFAH